MPHAIDKAIRYLISKPKILFLVDALGALLTTILVFVVLRNFSAYIGVPDTVLNILSAVSLCCCLYSAACFLFLKSNWTPFIRVIVFLNIMYCVFTLALVITHRSDISTIGIAYFLGEVSIIGTLVYIENKVAMALKHY
jgi:hypothetical protein